MSSQCKEKYNNKKIVICQGKSKKALFQAIFLKNQVASKKEA